MLISLDFSSDKPIYLQIRDSVVLAIAEGRMLPGEKLPTIRALAEETGVNTMTVNKAYQLLKQDGFISIDRRSGAYIKENMHDALTALRPGLMMLFTQAQRGGASRKAILELCSELLNETEAL